MEFLNASQFRAQAEKCFRQSQLIDDRATKLRWLSLAEIWFLLSENMSRDDFNETFGVRSELYSLPRHDTEH